MDDKCPVCGKGEIYAPGTRLEQVVSHLDCVRSMEQKAQRFRDYADSADRQCEREKQRAEQAEAKLTVWEDDNEDYADLLRKCEQAEAEVESFWAVHSRNHPSCEDCGEMEHNMNAGTPGHALGYDCCLERKRAEAERDELVKVRDELYKAIARAEAERDELQAEHDDLRVEYKDLMAEYDRVCEKVRWMEEYLKEETGWEAPSEGKQAPG